jgi:hypothetical protein
VEVPVVDAEEQELRELGRQTDIAEGRPVESEGAKPPETPAPPAKAPETPQVPEKKPDSSEPEPELPLPDVAARERDDKGRFKGKEEAPVQENGEMPPPAPVEKPPSKFAQAKEREAKEVERRERSWTALQQEKERLRAEQAEWEDRRRREELEAEVRTQPLVKDGIDLQGYQKAYQDFRQRAMNSDLPEDWRNSLHSLETVLELEARGRQEQERVQQSQYELAWRKDMEAALSQNPELKDPNTPFRQEVERLIQSEPYMYYIPGGFNKIVELATILLSSGADSELRDELERKNARIEELERGSQPARGGPGKPPQGPKSFDDMTDEEQEAHLRAETERQDLAMRR